jgi:hypothetical protein
VEDFGLTLRAVAEGAEIKPGTWTELFAVPAEVDPEAAAMPDPAPVAEGVRASGHFAPGLEISLQPLWFDADAVVAATPCAIRRALRSLAAGQAPAGLKAITQPPASGTVVMLGVTADSYPIPWEEALQALLRDFKGETPAEPPDPVQALRDAAFEDWREALLASSPDLLDIRPPLLPSRLADDIDDVPDDDDDEVVDFIDIARREAGGEPVVCVPRVAGGRVELALYTASGRLLDAGDFGKAEDGAVPAWLREIVAALVPVLDEPPRPG